MERSSEILKDNKFTPEDLPEFESKLFFEGSRRQRYLVPFFVLMFFASVIATGAIIAVSRLPWLALCWLRR